MSPRQRLAIRSAALSVAMAFVFLASIRGIMELLHPKYGGVTELAYNLGFGDWWLIHVGLPGYQFLTDHWGTAHVVALALSIGAGALLWSRASRTRGNGA